MKMPVPSSYNDITTSRKLRDYVGPVWYQRHFFVPLSWSNEQRVFIRFGSVNYLAQVVINFYPTSNLNSIYCNIIVKKFNSQIKRFF